MRSSWQILALVVFLGCTAGCQTTPAPGLVSCPLPVDEQTAQILDIVPLGTPRDVVIEKLEKAGVIGNFSTGDSKTTYYCDIWQREKDERWHINVVLLFDENGLLYSTRPRLGSPVANPTETTAAPSADPLAQPVIGNGALPLE